MQESHVFKKKASEKFIIWQLVVNFADFCRNNGVFMQNNCAFKNLINKESLYFDN